MFTKSKKQMLAEMGKKGWNIQSSPSDSYDDVLAEYQYFQDELSSDFDLFPNGRDYDAEDESGPF